MVVDIALRTPCVGLARLIMVLFISTTETSGRFPPQPASYPYSVIARLCGQARVSLVNDSPR